MERLDDTDRQTHALGPVVGHYGTQSRSLTAMRRLSLSSFARTQSGMSLFPALMFLLVLAVLGMSVLNSTLLQEKMAGNTKDTALVRSIIAMAHALGLSVVAEGVETADVLELLQHLNCDAAQGYYVSRPLPAAAIVGWLQAAP